PKELFHISATDNLRVYVDVPEANAIFMQPGLNAMITLRAMPGKSVPAKLVRTANAISPSTRTMRVELEIANKNSEFLPGAYAEVRFVLPARADVLRVPSHALLYRANGLNLVTLNAEKQAVLKPITVGRDYGSEIEVLNGIAATDAVVLNPPDSIFAGEKLQIISDK
ncbi:MAG TPA: efflux RND transporter periplasmic adaptor subunit, partial [Pseudomonadales bacterium]|nr:efflux RND transporter periplasmic adaptor subunit [Pseudomonadales bacterium]